MNQIYYESEMQSPEASSTSQSLSLSLGLCGCIFAQLLKAGKLWANARTGIAVQNGKAARRQRMTDRENRESRGSQQEKIYYELGAKYTPIRTCEYPFPLSYFKNKDLSETQFVQVKRFISR